MNKKFFEQEKIKLEVCIHENYLRLVFQSCRNYNHRARLDIAKILYAKFKDLTSSRSSEKTKVNIFKEIYR